MTPEPRRRGRPGYDLPALLAAAVEVFNERGYDGTRVDDLARRLGLSKSAIYHHVRGKEELLQMALDRALDGLFAVAAEAEAAAAGGAALPRLELLVRGSVRVLSERLPFVTLLLRVHGTSEVERTALARRRDFDDLVAALVQRAVDEGDVRPDVDPAVTARLLFGLVNSLVEWYRPRTDTDHVVIADAVVGIAFDGIRTRRGP
jgi:AcrR family transcriptional regulator